MFGFGIGSSVNRFLLDKITEYGRGEVEYVGLNDDGTAAAKRFHERVRNPLLTDITVEWNGLPVADVYPQRIPDLFSAKPVVLTGRYLSAGSGTLRLKGKMSGNDFVREIPVQFPDNEARHDVLASLWARQRIDDLMGQDYGGAQRSSMRPDLKETITQLGLEFRLMTQFTSFVAVEEMVVTDGGQPRRIDVPVEVPEGMERQDATIRRTFASAQNLSSFMIGGAPRGAVSRRQGRTSGSASGGGSGPGGGGAGGGTNRPSGTLASPTTGSLFALIYAEPSPTPKLSPKEERRQRLQTKADAVVISLVERLQGNALRVGLEESRFIFNGKAELQVWLTEKSDKTIAELKALGFEVMHDSKASNLVIGRIPLNKIATLIDLKSVRYVAPLMKK